MQEKKKKMTLMQSLCAFLYPRAYNSLLLLISTLGLSVEGTFVDYRFPPPHLGNSNNFDCSRFVVGSE